MSGLELVCSAMLSIQDIPGKGRGVCTDAPIAKDAIVEVCPAIILSHEDVLAVRDTVIYEYTFDYDDHGGRECLPCGFGMLYNHSATPNIEWDTDLERQAIVFTALRDIKVGEELCHNYWPEAEVLFDDRGRWRERLEKM